MKFCLDCRLSGQYLKTAHQIKVQPRDKNYIYELLERYEEQEIILVVNDIPDEEMLQEFKKLDKLSGHRVIFAYNFYPRPEWRKGLRWYANYPVESFSEANALITQGSEYIRLGSPLMFMIDKVAQLQVPVRLVPNQPYLSAVPRENGICGQWIRPEDLHLYDERLTDAVTEFDFCRLTEEEALYRVYSDEQRWPGPLSYLVQNLNDNALNRLLEPGIGLTRLNCGHKCQDPTGSCHVCPNSFKLANMLEAKHRIDKN